MSALNAESARRQKRLPVTSVPSAKTKNPKRQKVTTSIPTVPMQDEVEAQGAPEPTAAEKALEDYKAKARQEFALRLQQSQEVVESLDQANQTLRTTLAAKEAKLGQAQLDHQAAEEKRVECRRQVQALQAANAITAASKRACEDAQQKLVECTSASQSIEQANDRLAQEAEVARKQLAESELKLQQAVVEHQTEEARIRGLEAELQALRQKETEEKQELDAKTLELVAVKAANSALEAEVAALRVNVREWEQRLNASTERIVLKEAEVENATRELATVKAQVVGSAAASAPSPQLVAEVAQLTARVESEQKALRDAKAAQVRQLAEHASATAVLKAKVQELVDKNKAYAKEVQDAKDEQEGCIDEVKGKNKQIATATRKVREQKAANVLLTQSLQAKEAAWATKQQALEAELQTATQQLATTQESLQDLQKAGITNRMQQSDAIDKKNVLLIKQHQELAAATEALSRHSAEADTLRKALTTTEQDLLKCRQDGMPATATAAAAAAAVPSEGTGDKPPSGLAVVEREDADEEGAEEPTAPGGAATAEDVPASVSPPGDDPATGTGGASTEDEPAAKTASSGENEEASATTEEVVDDESQEDLPEERFATYQEIDAVAAAVAIDNTTGAVDTEPLLAWEKLLTKGSRSRRGEGRNAVDARRVYLANVDAIAMHYAIPDAGSAEIQKERRAVVTAWLTKSQARIIRENAHRSFADFSVLCDLSAIPWLDDGKKIADVLPTAWIESMLFKNTPAALRMSLLHAPRTVAAWYKETNPDGSFLTDTLHSITAIWAKPKSDTLLQTILPTTITLLHFIEKTESKLTDGVSENLDVVLLACAELHASQLVDEGSEMRRALAAIVVRGVAQFIGNTKVNMTRNIQDIAPSVFAASKRFGPKKKKSKSKNQQQTAAEPPATASAAAAAATAPSSAAAITTTTTTTSQNADPELPFVGRVQLIRWVHTYVNLGSNERSRRYMLELKPVLKQGAALHTVLFGDDGSGAELSKTAVWHNLNCLLDLHEVQDVEHGLGESECEALVDAVLDFDEDPLIFTRTCRVLMKTKHRYLLTKLLTSAEALLQKRLRLDANGIVHGLFTLAADTLLELMFSGLVEPWMLAQVAMNNRGATSAQQTVLDIMRMAQVVAQSEGEEEEEDESHNE